MGNYLYWGHGPIHIPRSLEPIALRHLRRGAQDYQRGDSAALRAATSLAEGLAAFCYETCADADGIYFVDQKWELKDTWQSTLEAVFDALAPFVANGGHLHIGDEGYGNYMVHHWSFDHGELSTWARGTSPEARSAAATAALRMIASIDVKPPLIGPRLEPAIACARGRLFASLWERVDPDALWEDALTSGDSAREKARYLDDRERSNQHVPDSSWTSTALEAFALEAVEAALSDPRVSDPARGRLQALHDTLAPGIRPADR